MLFLFDNNALFFLPNMSLWKLRADSTCHTWSRVSGPPAPTQATSTTYGGNGNYLLQLLAKNLEELLIVEDEDCDYIVLVEHSLDNTWLTLKFRKC